MSLVTPVLLIAWRRPETTRQVISAIRSAAPSHMYVACDGPDPTDIASIEKVVATKAVIDSEIDWPCTVHKRYCETNQGCKIGVSSAISWFFDQVEEGIILEDDCVPHPDFFPYCAELLERFRLNEKIWCISGNNFQDGTWRGDGSYYFSNYNHCWGWASWRRCWAHYDSELLSWPDAEKDPKVLEAMFEDPAERSYWLKIWSRLFHLGEPNTWDYQWTYACISKGGLSALPNSNLVSNVGFGNDATHTTEAREPTSFGQLRLLPLIHPTIIRRDSEADSYTYSKHLNPEVEAKKREPEPPSHCSSEHTRLNQLLRRVKQFIRNQVRRIISG